MVSIQALHKALHNLFELYRVDRKVPITHLFISHHVGNCVGPRDRLSVGAGLVEKQASSSSHTLKLSLQSRPNGWTRLRPDSNAGDQTLLVNHPLHFTPSSGEWGWRRGSAKGETAWFEDKNCSRSTIYPSISVPK